MAPVTRIDEDTESRKHTRLRRALQRSFTSLVVAYYQAYERLTPLAVETDLEKYHDIYEISRLEAQDVENLANEPPLTSVEDSSLQSLRIGLRSLHNARRLFFCSLLALDADGSSSDLSRWPTAVNVTDSLTVESTTMTREMDSILKAEEGMEIRFKLEINPLIRAVAIPAPTTPEQPLTPGRERIRTRLRKISSLSQGVRGLQAKIHLLREDADKLASNQSQNSVVTATRYNSIGADLKNILDQWEQGQAAFTTDSDSSHHTFSIPLAEGTRPPSPTVSLGGLTAVDESSLDALAALNGYSSSYRSSSSTANSTTGDEVFEAVAVPWQRSALSREERITKMREDRVQQAVAKHKAEATSHMLKELETVIKLRPRGRTTGRVTSI